MNKNYELLANAVVIQSTHDYRRALCKQHELLSKENLTGKEIKELNMAKSEIKEIERFFLGEDILLYTRVSGRMIMDGVKAQVINANYDITELSRTYNTKNSIPD